MVVADGSGRTPGLVAGWLPGLVLGTLNAFLLLELGWMAPAFLAATVLLILWKGPRLGAFAGLLTGAGLIWTVLFSRVGLSCAFAAQLPGEDCQAPGIVPWILVSVVTLALGVATSAIALRRSRRR